MSKCQKCGFDPENKIYNALYAVSEVYNIMSAPSFAGERAVPLDKAILVVKKLIDEVEAK
jgi:hypothetical protein